MSNDEAQLEAARARDILLDLLDAHDRECSDPSCMMAADLAAYIAHSLGIKSKESLTYFEQQLTRYNEECPACTRRN